MEDSLGRVCVSVCVYPSKQLTSNYFSDPKECKLADNNWREYSFFWSTDAWEEQKSLPKRRLARFCADIRFVGRTLLLTYKSIKYILQIAFILISKVSM